MKLYKKNIFQTEIRASDDQTDEQIGTLGPEPLSKPAVLSLFLLYATALRHRERWVYRR